MHKEIFKLVKQFILFIGFVIPIYILMLITWGDLMPGVFKQNLSYFPAGYGHLNTRIKEIKDYPNVDILVLGSSHAYRGFDSRIFEKHGYSMFNLGSSSQTPLQTRVLLDRYLDVLAPKLIIYEVNTMLFDSDGIESSLDLLANDRVDYLALELAISQNHIKVYNSLIYSWYCNLLSRNDLINQPLKEGKDIYVSGGFVEREISYFKKKSNQEKIDWTLKKNQLSCFENIIASLKKKDIKVILIQAPITKNDYSLTLNNAEFDSLVTTYAPYYNFNKIMDLDDSLHFYDNHHLNQNGVILFNHKILEKIDFSMLIQNK